MAGVFAIVFLILLAYSVGKKRRVGFISASKIAQSNSALEKIEMAQKELESRIKEQSELIQVSMDTAQDTILKLEKARAIIVTLCDEFEVPKENREQFLEMVA